MTTTSFLLAMFIIAALFLVSYFKEKRKKETKKDEKTFPSGRQMLSDSEILELSLEELRTWEKDDLKWLINYMCKQYQRRGKEEQKIWDDIIHKASRALFSY